MDLMAQPNFLTDWDLGLLAAGTHYRSFESLGAHSAYTGESAGTRFAVWAPNADAVSVIGDFQRLGPPAATRWSTGARPACGRDSFPESAMESCISTASLRSATLTRRRRQTRTLSPAKRRHAQPPRFATWKPPNGRMRSGWPSVRRGTDTTLRLPSMRCIWVRGCASLRKEAAG